MATHRRDGPTYAHAQSRIAYLANPKTASISTGTALHEQAGFTSYRVHKPHHVRLAKPMPNGWIVCTTIRDPFDTFVSWYFHLNKHDKEPFSVKFLEELVGQPDKPTYYFPDPGYLWKFQTEFATHLLRFEKLQIDVNRILALRGLGPVVLPEENVSASRNHRPYQEFHTPETRMWVENHYAIEMAKYGYHWEDA